MELTISHVVGGFISNPLNVQRHQSVSCSCPSTVVMDCPKWILSGLCLISLVSGATVIELLGTLKLELDFEYVLLMKNRNFSLSDQVWNGTSLTKDVMDEVQVPVLQFNENVSYFLHNSISRRLVTLGFMSDANLDEHRGLLTALVANLRHMTTSRVIFLVQSKASTDFLYELFRNCWRKKLLNVIVIFQDFEVGVENFRKHD